MAAPRSAGRSRSQHFNQKQSPFANIETSYGTQQTPLVSGFTSAGISKWLGSFAGEFFQTDGFIPVEESQRGTVDTKANVSRWGVAPFVERSFGGTRRVFGKAETFHESRENGTPLQTNETDLWNISGGLDWDLTPRDLISIRANGGSQDYDQTFSAVAPDRNSETLNRLQHVPSSYAGLSGQWTGTHRSAVMFAGFDIRGVHGHSGEIGLANGVETSHTDAGGDELTGGVFAGIVIPVGSRLTVSGGFRADWWKDSDGFSRTTSLVSGSTTATDFPDRSEAAFSPRLSAIYRATKNLSIAATYSEGFRRPTLNELYRNFRVGDILTLANPNLSAERARGFDTAAIITAFDRKLYIRSGVFCTFISENVSNVTLSAGPTLIIRQRQNVGETRACGFEADWNFVVTNELTLSGWLSLRRFTRDGFSGEHSVGRITGPQVAPPSIGNAVEVLSAKIGTIGLQVPSEQFTVRRRPEPVSTRPDSRRPMFSFRDVSRRRSRSLARLKIFSAPRSNPAELQFSPLLRLGLHAWVCGSDSGAVRPPPRTTISCSNFATQKRRTRVYSSLVQELIPSLLSR
jgi:hypothetical protein